MSELTSTDIEELEEMAVHYPLVRDALETIRQQAERIQTLEELLCERTKQLLEIGNLYDCGARYWNPVYQVVLDKCNVLQAELAALKATRVAGEDDHL